MKKIVERDRQSGKVKDNLYKGQHTHAPPTPGRLAGRSSLGKGPATAMICKVCLHRWRHILVLSCLPESASLPDS